MYSVYLWKHFNQANIHVNISNIDLSHLYFYTDRKRESEKEREEKKRYEKNTPKIWAGRSQFCATIRKTIFATCLIFMSIDNFARLSLRYIIYDAVKLWRYNVHLTRPNALYRQCVHVHINPIRPYMSVVFGRPKVANVWHDLTCSLCNQDTEPKKGRENKAKNILRKCYASQLSESLLLYISGIRIRFGVVWCSVV